MALLTYITNISLDGFIEDADGGLDWTDPSDEVFTFLTDLIRPVGTLLYGRGLYEAMAVWETDPALAEQLDGDRQSELTAEFSRVWQAPDKVVFSTTLAEPSTARTRIERRFDPEAIRALKASATDDLTIGGAQLASHAFAAGLVDECHLVVHPAVLGRGKPAFGGDVRAKLDLLDERRFDNGAVHLRYRVSGGSGAPR